MNSIKANSMIGGDRMEINHVYKESDKAALGMGVFSIGLLAVIVLISLTFSL
jgi:hypothetical protein